jgi:hypothetical protein
MLLRGEREREKGRERKKERRGEGYCWHKLSL